MITMDWEKPFNKISTHSWLIKKKKKNTQQTGIKRVFHQDPGGHLLKKAPGDAPNMSLDSRRANPSTKHIITMMTSPNFGIKSLWYLITG